MLVSIIYLLIVVLLLVSMWKVYEKAGRQGWEGIIPIYNLYVMLQIINRPWWWLLIMIFVPIANIIFSIIAMFALRKTAVRGEIRQLKDRSCAASPSPGISSVYTDQRS
mgnify:CR=1 FL=1